MCQECNQDFDNNLDAFPLNPQIEEKWFDAVIIISISLLIAAVSAVWVYFNTSTTMGQIVKDVSSPIFGFFSTLPAIWELILLLLISIILWLLIIDPIRTFSKNY